MNALEKWMTENKVTDGKLAADLSVSRVQVLRLRRGENGPSKETARELERVTGIPAATFVFGEAAG